MRSEVGLHEPKAQKVYPRQEEDVGKGGGSYCWRMRKRGEMRMRNLLRKFDKIR